jgi:hypothetical protein
MEAADEDCIVKASSVCACCGLVVSTYCRPDANTQCTLVGIFVKQRPRITLAMHWHGGEHVLTSCVCCGK